MPTKQQLEALSEEGQKNGLSEAAQYLYKKIQGDFATAITLLSDKLTTHIKTHPNRDEAHSLSITILGDKVSTKAKKEAAITTANATDLATAITLLNEIKTKLNSMNS
jgi:hypothetical protein